MLMLKLENQYLHSECIASTQAEMVNETFPRFKHVSSHVSRTILRAGQSLHLPTGRWEHPPRDCGRDGVEVPVSDGRDPMWNSDVAGFRSTIH